MKETTTKHLEQLIQQYMDGIISPADHRRLAEMLSHEDQLPAEMCIYAEMFRVIARPVDTSVIVQPVVKPRPIWNIKLSIAAAILFMAVVGIVIAFNIGERKNAVEATVAMAKQHQAESLEATSTNVIEPEPASNQQTSASSSQSAATIRHTPPKRRARQVRQEPVKATATNQTSLSDEAIDKMFADFEAEQQQLAQEISKNAFQYE